jgi:uncharacterized tellurite resistance protein B-like protein
MIKKISQFFTSLTHENNFIEDNISLEIATAVLLFEVMAADDHCSEQEQLHINTILQEKFSLAPEEIRQIMAQAQDHASHATDLYRFTKLINSHTDIKQRIAIVEKLWQLAYVDGHLSVHEEQLVRKIADLLHLRHNEYINAKIRAQQDG